MPWSISFLILLLQIWAKELLVDVNTLRSISFGANKWEVNLGILSGAISWHRYGVRLCPSLRSAFSKSSTRTPSSPIMANLDFQWAEVVHRQSLETLWFPRRISLRKTQLQVSWIRMQMLATGNGTEENKEHFNGRLSAQETQPSVEASTEKKLKNRTICVPPKIAPSFESINSL